MARERVEVEVDGVTYSMCQIAPTKAGLMFLKLLRIFGPAFGKAFLGKGIPTVEEIQKLKTGLADIPIDQVLETVADRMEEEEIMDMARKLLGNTYPLAKEGHVSKGGPMMLLGTVQNFDQHFDSMPGLFHLIKVVKEVFVLQFADFFGGLGTPGKPESVKAPTQLPLVP